jgi:hypothetical protein
MMRAPMLSSLVSAQRQGSQALSALLHPTRSAQAVVQAAEQTRQIADVPQTVASASGDMLGSAAAVTGVTMAATAAMSRPYMGTEFAQGISRRYSSAVADFPAFLRSQRAVRFVATRPLALGLGAIAATAAFIGSASGREEAARENASRFPEVTGPLAEAGLDQLAATQVSRIVRAGPAAAPPPSLSPMSAPPTPRPTQISEMPPPPASTPRQRD